MKLITTGFLLLKQLLIKFNKTKDKCLRLVGKKIKCIHNIMYIL